MSVRSRAELDVVDGADPRRPVAEHDHPVGERDRLLDVVGDQQDRAVLAAHQPGRVALDHELGLEVERRERLVEQQHLRVVDQGARQRHALAHAARQRGGIVGREAVQAQLVEQHMRPLPRLVARQHP